MPRDIDRFLSHRKHPEKRPSLGRVFSVICETWSLKDDPKATPPEVTVVATRRSAADAADIAREAATEFRRRGFHKPSRAWWGADDGQFHRYVVHGPKARPGLALLLLSGVAAAGALAFARSRRGKQA